MTEQSNAASLPPDIGHLDAETINLLRGTIGLNLYCDLIDGTIRPTETDPTRRIVARGAVFTAAPRPGRPVGDAIPGRFWLRPVPLPQSCDYAVQRLQASRNLPSSLLVDEDVATPRLGARLATSLESVVTVTQVAIVNEPLRVAYADSDGDVGVFGFDTRIDFIGTLLNRTLSFSVQAGPSDSGWLSLLPAGLVADGTGAATSRQTRLLLDARSRE